jgi:hypothetical protein
MSETPERAWLCLMDDRRAVVSFSNVGTPFQHEYVSLAALRAELEKLREACAKQADKIGPWDSGMKAAKRIRALDIDAALGKEIENDA